MKRTLSLVNMYLKHNHLFEEVSYLGGDNIKCVVKMNYSDNIFTFISVMKKYIKNTNVYLKMDKITNIATITFRKNK